MNIGKKLKQIRLERHLTVNEVSKNTGIPKSCIYDYESSRIDPPLKRYMLLMEYYGLDPDMMFLGKEYIDITDYTPSGKIKAWMLNKKESTFLADVNKQTDKGK